ncbi:MAG: hypothetical protein ACRDS9_02830 [Pseudonocardiaceae bacterium]
MDLAARVRSGDLANERWCAMMSPERLTVITPDDEPQTRWHEFIRLVRAGQDVAHVAELLEIIQGWRSQRVANGSTERRRPR